MLYIYTLVAAAALITGGTRATIEISGYVPPRTTFHEDGGYTSNENITVQSINNPDAGTTTLVVTDDL